MYSMHVQHYLIPSSRMYLLGFWWLWAAICSCLANHCTEICFTVRACVCVSICKWIKKFDNFLPLSSIFPSFIEESNFRQLLICSVCGCVHHHNEQKINYSILLQSCHFGCGCSHGWQVGSIFDSHEWRSNYHAYQNETVPEKLSVDQMANIEQLICQNRALFIQIDTPHLMV